MKFKVVKLDFKSPLHLGDIGVDLLSVKKYWHSDGVFSALFNAFSVLFPEDLDEIASIVKESFYITSAFPYVKDILFFPAPKIKFVNEEVYLQYRKKIKKLEFLPLDYFEKVINLEDKISEEELKKIFENIEEYIASIVSYKRNKIDRNTQKTLEEDGLFEIAALEFPRDDSGLWFGVKCSEEFFEIYLEPALKFLQDQGVGGDHTVGFGQFEYKVEDFEIKSPENSKIGINLSAVFSTKEDIKKIKSDDFSKLNWDFVIRGGYPFFSYFGKQKVWKPQLMMIKEASVLPVDVEGKIVELEAGDYKAYHYGKAFMLPINSGIEI